jgi:hypothetical protein
MTKYLEREKNRLQLSAIITDSNIPPINDAGSRIHTDRA